MDTFEIHRISLGRRFGTKRHCLACWRVSRIAFVLHQLLVHAALVFDFVQHLLDLGFGGGLLHLLNVQESLVAVQQQVTVLVFRGGEHHVDFEAGQVHAVQLQLGKHVVVDKGLQVGKVPANPVADRRFLF